MGARRAAMRGEKRAREGSGTARTGSWWRVVAQVEEFLLEAGSAGNCATRGARQKSGERRQARRQEMRKARVEVRILRVHFVRAPQIAVITRTETHGTIGRGFRRTKISNGR